MPDVWAVVHPSADGAAVVRKHVRKQLVQVSGAQSAHARNARRPKPNRKAKRVVVPDLSVAAAVDPWAQVDRRLDLGDILTFIRCINPKIGQVLSLALTGLSTRQIASEMGLAHKDVDRAFSAARDILRGSFQGMLPGNAGT